MHLQKSGALTNSVRRKKIWAGLGCC
jgi:hypothetical protein